MVCIGRDLRFDKTRKGAGGLGNALLLARTALDGRFGERGLGFAGDNRHERGSSRYLDTSSTARRRAKRPQKAPERLFGFKARMGTGSEVGRQRPSAARRS